MAIVNTSRPVGGYRVTTEGVCVSNAGPFDTPTTPRYTLKYFTDERAAKQAAVEAGEETIKRIQRNIASNKKWLTEHPLPKSATALYGVDDEVKVTGGALDGALGTVAGVVKHGNEFMYLVDVPGRAGGVWFYKENLEAPSDKAKVAAAVKAGQFKKGDMVKVAGWPDALEIVATKEKKGHTLYLLANGDRWYFARQLEAVS